LYVLRVNVFDEAQCQVRAWRPNVPGVAEVFHAEMNSYSYPDHCHDVWTILMIDEGAVRYDLDGHDRVAQQATVSLLPPHVVHNGSPVETGFRKRVLYLDSTWLDHSLIGTAVDRPLANDTALYCIIDAVHRSLVQHDLLAAETLIATATEHVGRRLRPRASDTSPASDHPTADRLRTFLDERVFEPITLTDAALALDRSPTHLARSFAAAFGIPPHAYVTARRIDAARKLLLDGMPPAEVAATVGFHDQAHLTHHFRRQTATTPGRFARRAA
jgi:AraC-like DNA-binding protein